MPDDQNQTHDERLFERLDRYVAALHAGNTPQCEKWLLEHPELEPWARCLDALDQFSSAGPGRASGAELPAHDALLEAIICQNVAPPADALGAAPSREFGRYELIEEIGRGGMGVVYKARQCDLDRIVAVKMILSNRLAGDDEIKRFHREARAAASVRHPQIVGIHDSGQIHGQHYFAMDYIAGRSLAEATRSGPLEADRAAHCLAGVARAVQFLHDHGIVHRDLKPSNILLDSAGTPHVTDFGLAKVFGEDDGRTQTGVILGTAGYMPPEQASGRIREVSPRSDVYSLGAILYEMLTGRPPFREDNPVNTILQVLESEPTLPNKVNPRVPAELERICLKCLEKAPERRYSSAATLADDLDRYLRSEPIEARPAGIVDHFRRWVRRETGLAARLAILLATWGIVEVRYFGRPWENSRGIRMAFATWGVLAVVFQWLLRRQKTAEVARLAWAVTDPIFLTIVLTLAYDIGPILVGYPVLIAASGLWFNYRLVGVSTAGCIFSYLLLLYVRSEPLPHPQYPVIFVVALAVIGFIVGFQVHRVRTLTRYFEQTRPPDAAG